MGEVYRALDTRLDREVAIKVLPADRTASETQRWQFVQEARAASALNHPHIITIHEIESVDGVDFMVMECLPGTTLDALISRNGMAVHEVLRVAIPIADALAAAHEHGIVHSDLKPANVIVSRQGHVKVLDFGLARFVADGKGDEGPRTVTMPDGDQQVTAGTPPYMSPEQASGRELDARSDIFSFGAVLYEMTTGRRAFGRESLAETLAAVLKDDPRPPHELTPGLPDSLEGIILRCLKKDPARRFQHASDIKVQLEEVRSELGGEGTASERRPRYARMVLASIALFALVSAAAVVRSRSRGSVVPPPTVQQLTSERWAGAGSFSPDGSQIAYASAGDDGVNWDIRLKIVGETVARRLTTDPAGEGYPSWSPDGTQIAFLRFYSGTTRWPSRFATGPVHVVSPLGGPARQVSDFPATLQLSWSPDGRWLAASKAQSGNEPPGGIYLLSVATGEARAVTFPPSHSYDLSPAFSPDGRELAYAACRGAVATPTCELRVLQLDAEGRPLAPARILPGERTGVPPALTWARDGRSMVYAAGSLWRVRTDGTSPPEPVPLAGHAASPCVSASGSRLAFVNPAVNGDIYRVGENGASRPLVRSSAFDMQPQYSPDGHRIALSSAGAGAAVVEVWLADADGSNLTRLTRGPGRFQGYPDGRRMDRRSSSNRKTRREQPTYGRSRRRARACGKSRATPRRRFFRASRATDASSTFRRTVPAATRSGAWG